MTKHSKEIDRVLYNATFISDEIVDEELNDLNRRVSLRPHIAQNQELIILGAIG